jgi:glycosyltransferase involved in cell wall biosynthesis
MRILAIVPSIYDTSPGQRYRIEEWEPLLRERGVEIIYEPFESKELHGLLYQTGNLGRKLAYVSRRFARRFSVISSVRKFDAVYVFREAALLGPPIFEWLIKRARIPMVFDFDDAIFVSYRSPSNGYLSYLKFAAKTKTICRMASHVMVGNPYLAEYARQFNPRVTMIPTTIDTGKYTLQVKEPAVVPVIGWTGSFSTVQHLDTLAGALQKLAKRDRFRLRVIGTPEYRLEGVEVEAVFWRSETEVDDLRQIDIGVMPLPDDAWSKGKCGLKALQFMALGVPTVCSPVGVNTDIIQDGENGFIAGTEDEWVEKLSQLLRSIELRRRLGLAGRATVEQRYSAIAQAPRVYEVLESIICDARGRTQASKTEPSSAIRQPG